jgi:6-phospho-beta-glucosidase
MQKGIKIVTIGGGSSYTPELMEGFINRYDELPIRELWLVDIEDGKEKLEIVGNLAKRMVEKANLPIEIHMTLDRREALKDADFVTTQFRVGLMDARIKDELIPLKYDVIGQETNGPGGLLKGFRTIPVILDICKDIEELCPEAWLINFANPSGMVTEAVHNYTNMKKMIGLCNVPIGVHHGLAKCMDVEPERIQIDFAGLNHLVYGLKVYLDGVECMDEAIEGIINPKAGLNMKNIAEANWEKDFIRGLGLIPCPYHKYYYKTDEMLQKCKEEAETKGSRGQVVAKLEEELFELYKDPNLGIKPPQLEERGGSHYSDAACELINAIYNDKKTIQTVNTLNRGAISNLPYDCAVEINCVITKDGAKPISVGELPAQVIGLVSEIKAFERMGVKAAVTGDYNTALVAMTINPLVAGDIVAKKILDEMLEAHKKYVPQFFK